MSHSEAVQSPDPASADLSSTLCTQCGLCCAGAVHDRVFVEPEERERLLALGLEVTSSDIVSFPQPCPFYSGDLCSIYDQRPRSCARYRCQLWRDVEAGKVSLSEAGGIVKTAKRLLADVQAAFPLGAVSARQFIEGSGVQTDEDMPDAPARLTALALMHYVDEHFRQPKEGRQLSWQSLGEEGGQEHV